MKKWIFIAVTTAISSSALAFAQLPPPPPGPPEGGAVGAQMERREMRRVIIRGDEDGPGALPGFGGAPAMGGMGFFLDTRPAEMMIRDLDLTPQQLGKVTEYTATARPEMRKLAREMAAEARRLRELSPGDASYASVSSEVAKKMGELTSRMVEQSTALRVKVWGVLTPEQRGKAEIRLKESREHMREHAGRRMKNERMKREQRRRGDAGELPRMFILERGDSRG